MKIIMSNLKCDDGSIVVVALIMLALLSIIGIAATNTSNTEMKISTNEQLYKIVFFGADTGIEVGRQILNDIKIANAGNWDNILAGTGFTWQDSDGNDVNVSTLDQLVDATWNRNVGMATYTLQVIDNDDLDGNPLVDTDNIVVLTSTATYRNARAQIQAAVRYAGPDDEYAQEHYNTGNTSEAANENGEVAGTQRW